MNFNNYTIKSQEAIQRAQQLAQGLGQQDIQVEHIFKGIQEVDNNVLPFILKKLQVNTTTLGQAVEKALASYKGSFQYINYTFAGYLPEYIEFINREQDLGDEGLRQAKMTYKPIKFIKKYRILS